MMRDFLLSLWEERKVSKRGKRENAKEERDEPSGVTGKLEDLSSEVLEDGGEVDWRKDAKRVRKRAANKAKKRETNREHRHRHAERSYHDEGDGGYDRRGTGDRPWRNGTAPWTRSLRQPFLPTFHRKTCCV